MMDPAAEVWAWLPDAVVTLGAFIFAVVVVVFCVLWGVARMREAATP